jgi:aspartate/glutamate racemase
VKLDRALSDRVHDTYNGIALHGKRGTGPEVDFFDQTARVLVEDGGAQAILLAGTDLSSFYADQAPSFRFLDVARMHIGEIIRRANDA